MQNRVRRFAPAAGLLLVFGLAAPSRADLIQMIDGKWHPWPAEVPQPGLDAPVPSEALGASEGVTIGEATYEAVRLAPGGNRPAANVRKLMSLAAARHGAYSQALNDASSGAWPEAADGFRAAAADLKGFAKQDALYNAMMASQETGDAGRALAAADELLAAFPKAFWYCDAQIVRAKVALLKNDLAAVAAALDAVKNAPGMNVRDAYRAQQHKVYFTLELQRKFDEAATEYRALIAAMDRERDPAAVATAKQRCQVGLGNCLLATRKEKEARGFFEAATASLDPDVLAGAYTGLGDIALTEARALRDAQKLTEAKAKLENEAVLHYLRVSLKYRPEVTDSGPVLRALENQATIFVALFDMSNSKDCESADRACRTYAELVRMLPQGSSQQRNLIRSYNEIAKRRDTCKAGK